MNLLLLILSMVILLFSLKKMTIIELNNKNKSVLQEIYYHVNLLLWGFPIVVTLLFIPYQTWILSGRSSDWDGVYIIFGTAIITILISFTIYYKSKVKLD